MKICSTYTLCGNFGTFYFIIGQCISKDGDPWKCRCEVGYEGDRCNIKTCNGTTFCKNGGIFLI